jgi:hypothetical protein
MPVVPLNVRSRVQFWVTNNGFSSLELIHKLPSFVPVQVNLTFPEGKPAACVAWPFLHSLPC